MLSLCSGILVESICTVIRPEFSIPTDLFLLFTHGYSTKIYGPLSFNLSFIHDHSTKNYGPHWFLSCMCVRPSDQSIWSFFIYSLFCAQPFDQDLGSSSIYFFYLHTTIRQKYTFLFHLFFLLCTNIRPKIKVHLDLFILFVHDHLTKIQCHHWFISFICKWPFDKNIRDLLSRIICFCTTIRPKIRFLINLFFSFVHDHSTKVRGHSYSLISFFLNCANISFALFLAVLPLNFFRYIQAILDTLIFRTLYS